MAVGPEDLSDYNLEELTIRADGRIEWVCDHGVGHPVGHVRGYFKEAEEIHGCDCCCFNLEDEATQ